MCTTPPSPTTAILGSSAAHGCESIAPLMLTGCLCSFIKGWGGLEDPDLSSSCSHQLYATLPFIGCGLEEGLKILSQGRLEEMGSIYGTRESPYPYWVKAFQVCAWKHLCSCKSCFGYALYGRKPSKLTGSLSYLWMKSFFWCAVGALSWGVGETFVRNSPGNPPPKRPL